MRSEVYFYDDEKDIPEGYRYDCENDEVYEYRNPYNGKVIHIAKNPPMYVKAIPIPDNVTNGDMMKIIFPNVSFNEFNEGNPAFVAMDLPDPRFSAIDKEWWDEPWDSGKVESEVLDEDSN